MSAYSAGHSIGAGIRRLLCFLRVTDDDGNLSLTHAALVFAAVCIWTGKAISLSDFGAFALALGAYQAKKYLARPGSAEGEVENDPSPRLDAVEKSVTAVAEELRQMRNGQAWAAVVGKRG